MRRESFGLPPDLLSGRTALIAGGTGSVGQVVVRAFLEAGATVVVPSRSEEKLGRLKEGVDDAESGRLITLVGNLSDPEDAGRVRETVLARAGPLDAAVATLGRFVPAESVLEAPLADLKAVLEGYLLAHFMVARTLIPALEARAGSYTFINGPLAFDPLFPGTGLVSIATAGQAMLARTVMGEAADGPVRVNELVLYTRFGRGGDDDPERGAVSRQDVGRFLARLASDDASEVRGETIHLDSLEPLRARAPNRV